MSDKTPFLDIQNLSVGYRVFEGDLKVLDDVHLKLNRGEKVGLVGEAGCGKTTTILSILGLLPPEGFCTDGKIMLGETEMRSLPEIKMRSIRANKLSVVFQDPAASLNPVYTIETQLKDAIKYSRRASGSKVTDKILKDGALEAIKAAQLPDPERILSSYPVQLSGGMKQRVCIGVALGTDSELILADEPGTSLDVTIQDEIMRLLKNLVEEKNKTILLVTHSLGVVREWTDRVYVMYAGTIVETGNTKDIFHKPLHPYTLGLLNAIPKIVGRKKFYGIPGRIIEYIDPPEGCRFYERCPYRMEVCRTEKPPYIEVGDNHSVKCFLYEKGNITLDLKKDLQKKEELLNVDSHESQGKAIAYTEENKLVSVKDIRKYFHTVKGTVKAVDGVDFDIYKGETLGLVGESGSGKSTASYVLIGTQSPTSGEIYYRNQLISVPGKKRASYTGKDMQMVFQDPSSSLNPRKNIYQILEMPLEVNGMPPRERAKRIDQLLDYVGLPKTFLTKYPGKIGGGEKQLVAIARALANSPSLLILDEPTSSLDVSMQANIINRLEDLRTELDLSYLFITHDLSLMRNIANRVAIMYLGKIQEIAYVDQFFRNPLHPYTKMLLSAIPVVTDEEIAAKPPRSTPIGEIASPIDLPTGCRFFSRCHAAMPECSQQEPGMIEVEEGHSVRCYLYSK